MGYNSKTIEYIDRKFDELKNQLAINKQTAKDAIESSNRIGMMITDLIDAYEKDGRINLENIDEIVDFLLDSKLLEKRWEYVMYLSAKNSPIYNDLKTKEKIDLRFNELFEQCNKGLKLLSSQQADLKTQIQKNNDLENSINKAISYWKNFQEEKPLSYEESMHIFNIIQCYSILKGDDYLEFFKAFLKLNSSYQAQEIKAFEEEIRKNNILKEAKKRVVRKPKNSVELEKIKERMRSKLNDEQFAIYEKMYNLRNTMKVLSDEESDLKGLLCFGLDSFIETALAFAVDLNTYVDAIHYFLSLIENGEADYDYILSIGSKVLDEIDKIKTTASNEHIIEYLTMEKMSDELDKISYAKDLIEQIKDIDDIQHPDYYEELFDDYVKLEELIKTYVDNEDIKIPVDTIMHVIGQISYYVDILDKNLKKFEMTHNSEEVIDIDEDDTPQIFPEPPYDPAEAYKYIYGDNPNNYIFFPEGYNPIQDLTDNSRITNKYNQCLQSLIDSFRCIASDENISTKKMHFLKNIKNKRLKDGTPITTKNQHVGNCKLFNYGSLRIVFELFDVPQIPGVTDKKIGVMIYGIAYGKCDKAKNGELDSYGVDHYIKYYYSANATKALFKNIGKGETLDLQIKTLEDQKQILSDIVNKVKGGYGTK